MWDNFKICNIYIIRIPGEERENRAEEIFEVKMAKTLPKLMTDTKLQSQETKQRTPNRINNIKATPKLLIFKLQKTKDKEKIMKEATEQENLTYRGTRIIITLAFSSELMKVRRR